MTTLLAAAPTRRNVRDVASLRAHELPRTGGDELLVARIVAGDERALATTYERYSGFVHALALRIGRDRTIAEDVTQEVFVLLWTHADRFDATRGSLTTWLGTIAHRRTVDRIRREAALRAREEREQRSSAGDGTADVSDATLLADTRARVRHALLALPDEQRRCVELAYLGGKTFREVAVVLGIAEGTAKSRIRLALGKLAVALDGAIA